MHSQGAESAAACADILHGIRCDFSDGLRASASLISLALLFSV